MNELYPEMRAALHAGRPFATVTLLTTGSSTSTKLLVWPDGQVMGSLGDSILDRLACEAALPLLAHGESRIVDQPDRTVRFFIESFVPPPTLFMVGGVHISIALAAMARVVGFRTVVVDARSAFASSERFAAVDELVLAWPDEALEGRIDSRSCIALLTHDPKLDDPALRVALRSPARYIGALGSPTTHRRRLERLRAEGFDEASLARIHGPIGLSIGARTPEEIAVSILAQIVQVQRQA